MAIDEGKLNTFVEQFVSDFGALTHAATTMAGDQFGLYEVLAKGPATAVELASRPHTAPRYLREWWSAQAASAYVRYELEDNLTPGGPGLFSASTFTFICTPASRSQEVGLCLAAQAGEARLRDVVTQGGFRHFRRASQTPFNLIFEARP
ncbi:hypothetical protein [Polaromonas sp. AET17H-212]|uniref:hypothetical protein n=1 Tax=Polaromonas sp. AET17H-212 TaxID=1977061 RepID=UPI000BBC2ABE|nr:hypothetical protein [Polaromonas sp. AET17H-212]